MKGREDVIIDWLDITERNSFRRQRKLCKMRHNENRLILSQIEVFIIYVSALKVYEFNLAIIVLVATCLFFMVYPKNHIMNHTIYQDEVATCYIIQQKHQRVLVLSFSHLNKVPDTLCSPCLLILTSIFFRIMPFAPHCQLGISWFCLLYYQCIIMFENALNYFPFYWRCCICFVTFVWLLFMFLHQYPLALVYSHI